MAAVVVAAADVVVAVAAAAVVVGGEIDFDDVVAVVVVVGMTMIDYDSSVVAVDVADIVDIYLNCLNLMLLLFN